MSRPPSQETHFHATAKTDSNLDEEEDRTSNTAQQQHQRRRRRPVFGCTGTKTSSQKQKQEYAYRAIFIRSTDGYIYRPTMTAAYIGGVRKQCRRFIYDSRPRITDRSRLQGNSNNNSSSSSNNSSVDQSIRTVRDEEQDLGTRFLYYF